MYAYPPLLKLLKVWCSQWDFGFFIAIFYCKSYIDFYALSMAGVLLYIYMAENKRIPRVQEIMNAMIPTKGVISMHSNWEEVCQEQGIN